jgi:hypothetical protein
VGTQGEIDTKYHSKANRMNDTKYQIVIETIGRLVFQIETMVCEIRDGIEEFHSPSRNSVPISSWVTIATLWLSKPDEIGR